MPTVSRDDPDHTPFLLLDARSREYPGPERETPVSRVVTVGNGKVVPLTRLWVGMVPQPSLLLEARAGF
jgi:hypothetical protein